jgi:hypothetical protein
MRKSIQELKTDFSNILISLKENQAISLTNFENLLKDVSYSLDNDEDFMKVLVSW